MSDDRSQAGAVERRDFLKLGGTAAAALVANTLVPSAAHALPPLPANPATDKSMPTRNLGKTGYRVGIFSLGGQAAVEQPNNEAMAVSIIERALDLGLNYIDSAAAYGGEQRWSQRYIGQVMKRRRAEALITSKTHLRTRDESLRLLEESLKLLNTDHLDLWQLHRVSTQDDFDKIFGKGGAIEAFQHAREQKMVRVLGITGHTAPDVLMEGIRRFPFDTILMAINAADRHHLSFAEKLLPLAVEKQMGIIGMKIPARGQILANWSAASFVRPGQPEKPGTLSMREAMYYVLSLPVSTVIVGCDSQQQVEENVKLAREFTPLSEAQMTDLATKAAPVAKQALFFRRWV